MHRGIGALGIAGFVVAALLIGWISGRFGQRVFDDEALTLGAIAHRSYLDLIRFYFSGLDVHPPLSFLWFRLLHDLQFPLWLQRVLSLAIAASGFALILDLLWRRLPQERACRVLAVILFLGAPLLYGMGASLRWYPLLVLPVALALWSALKEERPTLLAAIAFGLAANISFLAAIPAAAHGIWRYLVLRQFKLRQDGIFIGVMLLAALPAVWVLLASYLHLPVQVEGSSLVALGTAVLGIFGGYGLGLTQSIIAVPFALLLLGGLIASIATLRRSPRDGLLIVSLAILGLCLILTALGFAKPRSFLFAVPFLLAAATLGVAQFSWRRWYGPVTAAASVGLTLAALWLLNASDRPFKRNLHIPDDEVLAAIRQHAPKDQAFIVSSDASLAWRLQQEGYCAVGASLPRDCDRPMPRVVVIVDDGRFAQLPWFSTLLPAGFTEYRLGHQQLFGDDEDGPTKTFLTGRLVPKWLISVAVYRRD